MHRRNFIRNTLGILIPAPMVVKASSLMPVVSTVPEILPSYVPTDMFPWNSEELMRKFHVLKINPAFLEHTGYSSVSVINGTVLLRRRVDEVFIRN